MAHFVSKCFLLSCLAILANPIIPPGMELLGPDVPRPYVVPGVGGELTRYIFNCLLQ